MRTTRLVGATLIVKLVLGLFLLGATSVAAEDACVLTVEPAEAQAGAEFVLSGSGYKPDQLILQRGTNEPVTIELDLPDADPFEIPIGSSTGDEGPWTATAVVDGTDCRATATFRVTLQNTDMIDDLMGSPSGSGMPLIVYLLVIVGGFGVGALAARHLRLAS
jgi:hypothetical protein